MKRSLDLPRFPERLQQGLPRSIGASRRAVVRAIAGTVAGAALSRVALADDQLHEALVEQNKHQGFEPKDETVGRPHRALPTLSPATVQATEQALSRYETIVGR